MVTSRRLSSWSLQPLSPTNRDTIVVIYPRRRASRPVSPADKRTTVSDMRSMEWTVLSASGASEIIVSYSCIALAVDLEQGF